MRMSRQFWAQYKNRFAGSAYAQNWTDSADKSTVIIYIQKRITQNLKYSQPLDIILDSRG
jgi:hypothetical protein